MCISQCNASYLTPVSFLLVSPAMRKRARVFYSGRVQGVGFRYGTHEVACGYEVTGFIRNLPDGRVEMVSEGEEEEVKAFLEGIRESQLGNYIRGADVDWTEATGEFSRFEITH